MSKKKSIGSNAELSVVKVDAVRNKQRRNPEFSDVKVDMEKQKQKEAESSAVTNGTRYKQSRDAERGYADTHKQRRNTHTAADGVPYDESMRGIAKISSKSNDYVYVNKAYEGSLNSVNNVRTHEPITCVYREQYWACSKWSFAKKIIAIAVGVVLGAGIGLGIMLAVGKEPEDVIGGIFVTSSPN